jgi:hypothetical protein
MRLFHAAAAGRARLAFKDGRVRRGAMRGLLAPPVLGRLHRLLHALAEPSACRLLGVRVSSIRHGGCLLQVRPRIRKALQVRQLAQRLRVGRICP